MSEGKRDLVAWPDPVEPWRDSGEGGLFACAVWPDDGKWGECCVESYAHLFPPDVIVSGQREEFWPGEREVSWDDPRYIEKALSLPMLGVVNLGSTPYSLFSEHLGEYFCVTLDNLSARALDLIDTLTAAYGVEAEILTFLDT